MATGLILVIICLSGNKIQKNEQTMFL